MKARAGCGALAVAAALFLFVLAGTIAGADTDGEALTCASMLFGPLVWWLAGVL